VTNQPELVSFQDGDINHASKKYVLIFLAAAAHRRSQCHCHCSTSSLGHVITDPNQIRHLPHGQVEAARVHFKVITLLSESYNVIEMEKELII
jgi:hypothetical protein